MQLPASSAANSKTPNTRGLVMTPNSSHRAHETMAILTWFPPLCVKACQVLYGGDLPKCSLHRQSDARRKKAVYQLLPLKKGSP